MKLARLEWHLYLTLDVCMYVFIDCICFYVVFGNKLLNGICFYLFIDFIYEALNSPLLTQNYVPWYFQGKYVTSRNIRDRLYRELERNLAMKVEDGETADTFIVSGRGTLHITILIENM